MTTDTALGVTKMVVADKIPLANVPYIVGFLEIFDSAILKQGCH